MMNFIKTNLRGMGQIMLQNNAWTGALFMLGIFINSWMMGVGALVGLVSGTVSARLLKYKKEDIEDGLYGFNGALVGIALVFFYQFNITLLVVAVLFSAISTILMNFMLKRKLAPFTFPFILSTWTAIFIINFLGIFEKIIHPASLATKLDSLSAVSMGVGQVMFQGSIITGIIFLIALFVNSRTSALYGFMGSVVGMLTGLLISADLDLINIGIFGFNAVLCSIAFSNDKKYPYLLAIVASIISVFIIFGFQALGLIALTTPFVFATWIVILLRNKYDR